MAQESETLTDEERARAEAILHRLQSLETREDQCEYLMAEVRAIRAERDTAQNELCTAKDQIPPDMNASGSTPGRRTRPSAPACHDPARERDEAIHAFSVCRSATGR